MDVRPDPLPDQPIIGLVAAESRPELDIHHGETLGWWCEICHQSDETLEQIVHEPGCDLSGRHGRSRYGNNPEPINMQESGEYRSDTLFTVLKWDTTDRGRSIHHDEVVCFRCDECGNLDETLFEIVHDAACRLAGKEFGPLHDHSVCE